MDDEEIIGQCEICGSDITEENNTSYDNICSECAGNLYEGLMHFFG